MHSNNAPKHFSVAFKDFHGNVKIFECEQFLNTKKVYFGWGYVLPGAPVVINLLQILMSARLPRVVVSKIVLIIRVVILVLVTLGISSTRTERRALS